MENRPLSFNDLMRTLHVIHKENDHVLGEAIDQAIQEAVRAATANNGAAKLTLQFKFSPGRQGELDISTELTAKNPRPKTHPTTLFTDGRNRLFNLDPRQPSFESAGIVDPQEKEAAHG